jgi:hypothetical protein
MHVISISNEESAPWDTGEDGYNALVDSFRSNILGVFARVKYGDPPSSQEVAWALNYTK